MSFASLSQQVADTAFVARLSASVQQEARENPDLAGTEYADTIRRGATMPAAWFAWPVSIATEDAYAYALETGNPNPGGDPTVITDADILAAVQANWPADV